MCLSGCPTKTTLSRSEIIVQRRSHAFSTRLETLHTTSYLQTPVDGAVSICRGTL